MGNDETYQINSQIKIINQRKVASKLKKDSFNQDENLSPITSQTEQVLNINQTNNQNAINKQAAGNEKQSERCQKIKTWNFSINESRC